ncbi:MAG TPA: hypothetical protein VK483_16775 [Chitinophagaceae bacterium]|nr:hypothetical protein [Chitinophagaceae bacterium]
MNELLPYEVQLNQQWIDLPLPDENMAWADMKRRLDEEDKRRVFPFWWSGCAGWGLLGILLLGLGWWILRPEKWFKKKQETEQTTPVIEKDNKKEKDTLFNRVDTGVTQASNSNDSIFKINDKDSSTIKTETILPERKKINSTETKDKTIITTKQGVIGKKKKQQIKTNPDTFLTKKKAPGKNENTFPPGNKKTGKLPKDSVETVTPVVKPKTDSVAIIVKTDTVIDSVQKTIKDSTTKKPQVDTVVRDKKLKKDSTKNKKMVFSAGIGLQQQLPVAGQKFVPYNSQGRKGTLADYIPSVYIRMTKPEKWFLQSEFRYGAPQYTKEFVYRQRLVNDTGANPIFARITSSTLKKTYYHQLPLVFNYFVRPNWSLGAGIQWNKFVSAISEKTVIIRNNILQQDSLVSKFIQKEKKDTSSELKKSYLQAIAETQYKWKRFSFGARYSFGLEPYIKFTLPGSGPQEEKNSSVQIFIRYELWKSKNKK